MESQILELLHIINNKIDTKTDKLSKKIDLVVDRLNDLEKDINNKPLNTSSNNEFLTVGHL